jgi:hypothetical protein
MGCVFIGNKRGGAATGAGEPYIWLMGTGNDPGSTY